MGNRINNGDHNTGNNNSGDNNTGDFNSGDFNSGDRNSGNFNIGYQNTGDRNSGNRNSGFFNTGNCNTGDQNSGNCNTGNCNTGDFNSGIFNAGNRNSGNYNTGDFNSGVGVVAHFCTFSDKKRPVYLFNRLLANADGWKLPTDLPGIDLTVWVPTDEMSDEARVLHPEHATLGGYLRAVPYKEAWAIAWREASPRQRKAVLGLPNFDPELFFEITGIALSPPSHQDPNPPSHQEITIDGKRYRMTLTPLETPAEPPRQ